MSIDYTGIVFKNSEHTFIVYVSTRNYVPNHFSQDSRNVYGVETILGCPIYIKFSTDLDSSTDCVSGLIVFRGDQFFQSACAFSRQDV